MAIYEVDTLKQSLKKYTVTLAIGTAIGFGMAAYMYRTLTPANKIERREPSSEPAERKYESKTQQRLRVFDSYTGQLGTRSDK